jgi:tetratricopeptide (TPR) repeat protein
MLLGDVYYKTRQTRLAQQFYEEWLELAQQEKDRAGQTEALVRLGRVSIENEDSRQAIELCKRALSLAEKIKNKRLQAMALGDLALAYQAAGKNWQANRTGERALKLADEVGIDESVAWAAFKYALIAHRQEKWSKALPPAKRAAALFTILNDKEMTKLSRKMVTNLERKG